MGIVVCIFMLLGLLLLSPLAFLNIKPLLAKPIILWIARLLGLMGLWNSLWYGLQNWQSFWGIAAIVSGISMILAAILILVDQQDPWFYKKTAIKAIHKLTKTLSVVILLVLLVSFILYAVTLIQLNLGYPIIT